MKWLSVPSSILAIVVATSAIDLVDHWKGVLVTQHFDFFNYRRDMVLFIVLLGVLGSLPGFVVHYWGNALCYVFAAVLSLIGYLGLAFCSTYTQPSEWLFFFTLLFLLIAGISSAIAIVAAVCTPVENFTRRGSILLIILLVGYLLMGYMFEESLRKGVFPTVRNSYYFTFFGIFVAVVYAISAALVREVDFDTVYDGEFASVDQIGTLIYIFVELLLIIALYIFYLKFAWYGVTAIIFGSVFLLNFILVGIMSVLATSR